MAVFSARLASKTRGEAKSCRLRGDPASGNHWLTMPHGAHHLDLREPRPEDPPDVTAARAEEQRILKGWIDEATATAAR